MSLGSILEVKYIYMMAFWRPYPPGEPFHYGLYVKTKHDDGFLYHVTQSPSWSFQIVKDADTLSSRIAVAAMKIGVVDDAINHEDLVELFERVPMLQSPRCAPGEEWRCNHWTRDAVELLAQQGWVQCTDVDKLWRDFREAALPHRDACAEGRGSIEVIDKNMPQWLH
ncbi:hypothetical protein GLOTRDRAFT_124816 [Gloeophyllum trabeum ATCC 11539]|uniref:Uncharacterized protein n=1 Tax=Gloeophyllum trabeum (strain ATCC 11539 / FP-39264 / Madison 617) TaxID=670483 RepID=S7S122_GLOTA|nr:uncharacterized protein GLOTRDRAFT_124816 [Gloeophyllum trabeum ATCC 11539]EPQ61085.1 hypothetical protein GLOTRDRAFT_124816 [Gloeophyllum trabeum ATCC 11539]